eukprot:GHVU01082325.1.p1 GENE.GHVU01082325.1~~GHVU01082325.1.p1  ORF type:complete len:475 (+),score=29.17 GHVU01082325.1:513-1937(+)
MRGSRSKWPLLRSAIVLSCFLAALSGCAGFLRPLPSSSSSSSSLPSLWPPGGPPLPSGAAKTGRGARDASRWFIHSSTPFQTSCRGGGRVNKWNCRLDSQRQTGPPPLGFGNVLRRIRTRKGLVSPTRPVPLRIPRPPYIHSPAPPTSAADCPSPALAVDEEEQVSDLLEANDPKLTQTLVSSQLQRQRRTGIVAREVLQTVAAAIRPGVTTDKLDCVAHAACVAMSAYPSPLGYRDFPKSICTSINEVLCHGIPDSTVLRSGDIINVDVTCYREGVHADTSETYIVGESSSSSSSTRSSPASGRRGGGTVGERGTMSLARWRSRPVGHRHTGGSKALTTALTETEELVHTARFILEEALKVCGPGTRYAAIGCTIHDLCDHFGVASLPNFCGHSIGTEFHGSMNIQHVRNEEPGHMAVGDVFTIEPIIVEGGTQAVPFATWPDKWTTVATDGRWSAQFEHTVAITEGGHEVLT